MLFIGPSPFAFLTHVAAYKDNHVQ
jgi:hypothetical protein